MTRNIYIIIFCSLFCLLSVACSDDDKKGPSFSIDKEQITLGAEGGKEIVCIESSGSWVATSSAPWVKVSPANGVGSTECEIVVDSSLVNGVRSATIRFTPETQPALMLTVNQTGFDKVVLPASEEIVIEPSAHMDDRYFETEVTANVQFKVEFDFFGAEEWLSTKVEEIELDRGARPRTVKLRFDWKMNTVPEERVADIKFIPVDDADTLKAPAIISVRQKAAVRIEDNRAGDSIALLVINERLNCWSDAWDASENMQYWEGVRLWEDGDEGLPCPEAVGRVRAVEYFLLDTKESIPGEVKYLKYLETLVVQSNVNTMLLSIDLGSEICELGYLKNLVLFSYGLVSLPDEFAKLGKTLEVLNLSGNNFTTIPSVITEENFPKLKSLNFVANRRWTISDLRNKDDVRYENGIGLNINTETDNSLRRLLLWENLEELALSNCYIEGPVPDFAVGEDGVEPYTDADVRAWGGDTIQYLADEGMPKILPNCKSLRLNLNFFTGDLPDWLLYHPYLLEWIPELLIFNQQEQGRNSLGELVRFNNVPLTFDYYYDVFPGMREKYELKEEITEE
ncbi:MAG: BACON domain-containing carbohydrate-binding protein [Bacteroidales bacterium]|nr:BACON domain-containing carbohydrate-binding protein [Bacteroidales bacterium]